MISPRTTSSIPLPLKRTSIVFLLITLIQWLSFLPYFALLFATSVNNDFLKTSTEADQVLYNTGMMTQYLSSGINPYLYGFLSGDFPKECREAITSIRKLRRN
jgi:hypothetical protein